MIQEETVYSQYKFNSVGFLIHINLQLSPE
jgi:hypothetical protein